MESGGSNKGEVEMNFDKHFEENTGKSVIDWTKIDKYSDEQWCKEKHPSGFIPVFGFILLILFCSGIVVSLVCRLLNKTGG
jgi:hypothetical protein